MANINRVLIAGNLTRDPQIRFLANEQAVANFSLAINRKYKGSDGSQKEDVTFVDVEAWGRTAELVSQYLVKGRGCFVEGRLKLDTWDDKEGKKQSKLRVVADSVQFLDGGGKKAEGDASEAAAPAASNTAAPAASNTPPRPAPRGSPSPVAPGGKPAPAPAGVPDDEPPF